MKMSAAAVVSMAVGLVLVSTGVALGQGKQGTRSVTLPFNLTDNVGNQWLIYGNGMVQQQGGNAPVFAQLAQITVNGANINMRGNQQGKVDEKTGELLLENLVAGGVSVTRRVLIDPGEGSIRFVDTFKAVGNNAGKAATVNLNYSNNFNFGIMQARTVMDPRRKDQPMGWAAMTHGNRAIHQTWAAAGSKLAPKINWPEGSNVLQVAFALEIPAGKEASLVHYHGSTETLEKAAELVGGGAKGARLLASGETGGGSGIQGCRATEATLSGVGMPRSHLPGVAAAGSRQPRGLYEGTALRLDASGMHDNARTSARATLCASHSLHPSAFIPFICDWTRPRRSSHLTKAPRSGF